MDSRRDFLKKAILLAAGGGVVGTLPASIQKAFAIDPSPGSTFLDAEHVVILMQENRSFDHCYGTLRGVRGFKDPRAITLPSGNPVWLQTNRAGETYAPFRLNLKDTKATWLGSLPHGWVDQADARNGGRHDGWLDAKASGHRENAGVPLTLGFYDREDIPFFYGFADAFTICDQNFCSSLTATIPNRLHLWTGTVREKQSGEAKARVRNEELDYDKEAEWKTFPERLEEQGISWRIYQNELSLPSGLDGEWDAWLSNFGDNPLENFTQYRVRHLASFRRHQEKQEKTLAAELERLEATAQLAAEEVKKSIADKRAELEQVRGDLATWTAEAFAKLTPHKQNLHLKAFSTNNGDPDYRELATMAYHDGTKERHMQVPKGDVFHQFREDVRAGKLPMVSWMVPPERFSDHPSTPWYGAWYLSETLDILTENPEVWKKTIFILCYDENDGYFDHVPPFVAPFPDQPATGKVSAGIDPALEHVPLAQEDEIRRREPDWAGRPGPIGLGFRVPLVIASPWSRGGYVCSQVFDHTSILGFLEKFLSHKTGRPVVEPNINAWRRTVCGDLTSVFRPYHGEHIALPAPVERASFFGAINAAQFQPYPTGFKKLSDAGLAQAREQPHSCPFLPKQEKGARPSCALPYELSAEGVLRQDRKAFVIQFAAGKELFGNRAAGAPFRVVALGQARTAGVAGARFDLFQARDYAVSAGDRLSDEWFLENFEGGQYHLRLDGPNGFFREFHGTAEDPLLEVLLRPQRSGRSATGNVELFLFNREAHRLVVRVEELAYGKEERIVKLNPAGKGTKVILKLDKSSGWHDLRIRVENAPGFEQRFAGRIETGKDSISDPLLG